MIDDDVQFEILHRGIQIFLNGLLQAVDFINEQHIAFLKVGQQTREVCSLLNGWATRAFEISTHCFGENVRNGGLAQTRRAGKQDVIERLVALTGSSHGNFQSLLDLGLAGEVRKERRTQRQFERGIRFVERGNGPFSHYRVSMRKGAKCGKGNGNLTLNR